MISTVKSSYMTDSSQSGCEGKRNVETIVDETNHFLSVHQAEMPQRKSAIAGKINIILDYK